jgi:uncharacterized protein with PQ loop repeat
MDDVSVWLIMALIAGLSLWVIYGIAKGGILITGGNLIGGQAYPEESRR